MYIIHETIAGNDPRNIKNSQVIGHYWHFTIRSVKENEYLDWLPHEKISEEVAYSCRITGAYKGVVSLARDAVSPEEVISASGDVPYGKYIYKLTDSDKKNVVELMKSAMRLFAKGHLQKKNQINKLMPVIDEADTIEKCEEVLFHYFKVNTASTQGHARKPAFKLSWIDWTKLN